MLLGYELVVDILTLSSVDVTIDDAASDSVSLFRCVTDHIVVSSGFIAGIDSSNDESVDDEMLTGDDVVYSKL